MPQGSILVPLLFVIYFNDLRKYASECKLNMYTDDTAVYLGSLSYIDLMLPIKNEHDVIKEWLLANKLTINVKKT